MKLGACYFAAAFVGLSCAGPVAQPDPASVVATVGEPLEAGAPTSTGDAAPAPTSSPSTGCPAGFSSYGQTSGCFQSDPCGDPSTLSYCGSPNSNVTVGYGGVTLSCPACPNGGQCGGALIGTTVNPSPWCVSYWCFQPCKAGDSQCPAVSPSGQPWGATLVTNPSTPCP